MSCWWKHAIKPTQRPVPLRSAAAVGKMPVLVYWRVGGFRNARACAAATTHAALALREKLLQTREPKMQATRLPPRVGVILHKRPRGILVRVR